MGQGLHTVPPVENLLGGHGSQPIAPGDELAPASHAIQLVAPSGEYVPAGHCCGVAVPVEEQEYPAGQLLQVVAPAVE